jgi:phage baseplate assembly protein W
MMSYGVPLGDLVFEDGDVTNILDQEVRVALATWEPGVVVRSVTPVVTGEYGVSGVEVDYVRASAQINRAGARINRAAIQIGGTVVEDITS